MNYSKLLTQTFTETNIERIDWYNVADPDLVWEFNCLMSLHEISTCSKQDVLDAVTLVAIGYRKPNASKLVKRVIFSTNIDGAEGNPTYPKDAAIIDVGDFPIPDEFNEWKISICRDQKHDYVVAVKDLNNGMLCVNIAMFGKLR